MGGGWLENIASFTHKGIPLAISCILFNMSFSKLQIRRIVLINFRDYET